MNTVITFGLLALFFAAIIGVLYMARVKDKGFTDYAVAGRSFGPVYQAMSFLNTWWPGTTFIAFAGLTAGAGVLGFYALSYSLMTVVLMYLMSKRVWNWGAKFNLRTQPDLFALRFDSKHIRTVVAVIGVVSLFPWIVLGLQALGLVFSYMSFGKLSFTEAVILGVVVMAIRQIWTIQMGMRGVVITDLFQGIVAYVIGTVLIIGLLIWLVADRGAGFGEVKHTMFAIPAFESGGPGPLYVFALIFTGMLGGWCWPSIFLRLYTASGVRSLKRSAAIGIPLSLAFFTLLTLLALLASTVPAVAKAPQEFWFIISQQAGGAWVLALAGIIVFAATMGNVDGNIQSTGAQVANDMIGNYRTMSDKQMVVAAKLGMVVFTALAAIVATLQLPALYTLAVLSYQGIIQLAVPQFLGIFWKRGNKEGAIAGMVVGFVTAVVLEYFFRNYVSWAGGLTSGVIALAVNAAIYVAAAYLKPATREEAERVEQLFAATAEPTAPSAGAEEPAPAPAPMPA
jgi:solute:Na+ symporter, SSS family